MATYLGGKNTGAENQGYKKLKIKEKLELAGYFFVVVNSEKVFQLTIIMGQIEVNSNALRLSFQ